ncbi:uncharacterized protein V6R79_013982 [Siganus canaliculatus]
MKKSLHRHPAPTPVMVEALGCDFCSSSSSPLWRGSGRERARKVLERMDGWMDEWLDVKESVNGGAVFTFRKHGLVFSLSLSAAKNYQNSSAICLDSILKTPLTLKTDLELELSVRSRALQTSWPLVLLANMKTALVKLLHEFTVSKDLNSASFVAKSGQDSDLELENWDFTVKAMTSCFTHLLLLLIIIIILVLIESVFYDSMALFLAYVH